jgi:uncharacterized protein YqeY
MPSAIAERLKQDVIAAMKAKDKDRLGVLRMLQSALKQVEVDERKELQDEDVIRILQSYLKKVRDAQDGARKAGREELIAANDAELAIVQSYLPAAFTDDELTALIAEAIRETGAAGPKDMGKVIQVVKTRAAGKAEGARISAAVKQALNS